MAESPTKATTSGKPRRTSGSLRKAHLARGAFLVEFATPSAPVDMFRSDVPIGIGPTSLQMGNDRQSAVDKYRTMERKGFRVTKDLGCLIPDEQYGTYQQGATIKGHQRTFAFFAHWCPQQTPQAIRNEYGWPMNAQISHLCHRRSCARVDHLICEEQWRNLKRNYCGFAGNCDCGNPLQCLRRYQMDNQSELPDFCDTREEAQEALKGAPSFVIHSGNRHEDRDKVSKQRKANKVKRKRSQELHAHATERKQARLSLDM